MELMSNNDSRDMRLLDGKRVQVKNLLDAGLLEPKAILKFTRPRLGEEYTAVVTDEGRLQLEDGRQFAAPSRAAMEAAGLSAIDGWSAWSVDGSTLSSLRRTLLEAAVESEPDEGEHSSQLDRLSARRNELAGFRDAAAAGNPASLSVRELLAIWSAKGRGQRVVDRILADLDNYGLTSDPDFRKVSLDTVISLNGPADEEAPAPDLPAEGLTGTLNQDSTELDVGLALGNLPSASAGITAVKPTDSIEKAMTEMRLNDFSQLPVMTTTREIKGSVTWRSIAKALAHSSDASLDDALEAAPVHSYEQDLVDVLGVLCDHDFIFVRDSKREISGIVTTADVVRLYGETATPFFLIGEIDHLLRGAISDTWTIEQVTAVCNPENERSLLSHDDLSFGDYQRMLENPERFEAMGWPLDRATFINRLDEVREIRNGVAHFDQDPLDKEQVDRLKNFLKVMRDLRSWDTR